jgi:hypothetical protein
MKLFCMILSIILFSCTEPQTMSEKTSPYNPSNAFSSSYSITGRHDLDREDGPVLNYAGSYITVQFEGKSLKARFRDFQSQKPQLVGFIINSDEPVYRVINQNSDTIFTVASGLEDTLHNLTMFKLHDPGHGAGGLQFKGLILDAGKGIRPLEHHYSLKIEFFGDSFTAGVGAGENGEPNGWYSFANISGRILNAQVHNNGIGGLAVMDNTGWYQSHTTGFESTYDKSDPSINDGVYRTWDFNRFTPNLVVFGFGINDNFGKPDAFEDPIAWKEAYKTLIRKITDTYGKDKTSIILHPANIPNKAYTYGQDVVYELAAEGYDAHWFRFSFDIDIHPTREMTEKMGKELADFIEILSD